MGSGVGSPPKPPGRPAYLVDLGGCVGFGALHDALHDVHLLMSPAMALVMVV